MIHPTVEALCCGLHNFMRSAIELWHGQLNSRALKLNKVQQPGNLIPRPSEAYHIITGSIYLESAC